MKKIKKIIKMIYDNKDIILNNKIEIFNKYMEFLVFIYGDKIMKPLVYEIIVGILSRLINTEDFINHKKESKIIMEMPNSKNYMTILKYFFIILMI